ncbi:MAG: 3-hydroxyacyl-CoA dehydrogenase [Cyclobacteriaceae bacterium]|nr:3-hydroxyacyl-CoA dehydrogenase [Cyclobacteriaceae bacterium]
MEILIIGTKYQHQEVQQKFGSTHSYLVVPNHQDLHAILKTSPVVFDFIIEDDPYQLNHYQDNPDLIVFLNTTYTNLHQLNVKGFKNTFIGFCGLPTFLNRDIFEVSLSSESDGTVLEGICKKLQTAFQVVADRVGFVTPRVICMIINEAYFAMEEGTATKEDIDLAMKLGTNYPFGPFEWCEKIGKKNVVALLNAMYQDTNDTRYKACDRLVKESGESH